ncbi:hypothetical protein [Halomarina oriensis]|uniref:Halobacterial output domain-containing protein n=1 Tax=Halomarina oriensis TaxID=671145 RepID=A0A6B0GN35_9EURY|nr:hypothetical protein [Halomarina oriensis]MWG35351.1 hypothetical protein [Halomarina oriensis]
MPTDNGACDWESTVVVVHEWGGDRSLERSIAIGIVDLCSTTRPPRPTPGESERVATIDEVFSGSHLLGGELTVEYAGYDVAVKHNGVVRIEGPTVEE